MKKALKPHIKTAYRKAQASDDFLKAFKFAIMGVISEHTDKVYLKFRDVCKEIDYISTMAKANGLAAREYLRLITMYVANKITYYHQQKPKRRQVSLEMHYAA